MFDAFLVHLFLQNMSSYGAENTTTSEVLSNGLFSLVLSGESGPALDLDDYADNVLTSFHDLVIETIDLQLITRYLNEIQALSPEVHSILTDKSSPLPTRKEYLITHVKAMGIEGFNLLVEALKSSADAPEQVELGEKLRTAILENISSSSDTSREASPFSTHEGFVSAIGSPLHGTPHHTPTSTANASADEQTPLLADKTDDNHTVTYKKKKVWCVQNILKDLHYTIV